MGEGSVLGRPQRFLISNNTAPGRQNQKLNPSKSIPVWLHVMCYTATKINWKSQVWLRLSPVHQNAVCDPVKIAQGKNPKIWSQKILVLILASPSTAAAAAKSCQSCPTLCNPTNGSPPSSHPWDSPGKNTGVGCHFLLHHHLLALSINQGTLLFYKIRRVIICSPLGIKWVVNMKSFKALLLLSLLLLRWYSSYYGYIINYPKT